MEFSRPYSKEALSIIIDYVFSDLSQQTVNTFENCLEKDEILESLVQDLIWLVISERLDKKSLKKKLMRFKEPD